MSEARRTADALKTIQLRRYKLVPGALPAFTAWWREQLLPVRVAFGYRLEFAYSIEATDEFVWAVSLPGNADVFEAEDARYRESPERAAAFQGAPEHVVSQDVRLVRSELD